MRKTNAYTDEFKTQVVEFAKTKDMSVRRIAKDFSIPTATLHSWIKQAEQKGTTQDIDAAEVKRLRKEIAILKEERDIFKKAMAIFSKRK
jgi:transposase